MKDKRCNKHVCSHTIPHEFTKSGCDPYISFCKCDCIPVPLSYYMKEVLKKDKE